MIPLSIALIAGFLAGLLFGQVTWLALLSSLGVGGLLGAVGAMFGLFWWEHRGMPKVSEKEHRDIQESRINAGRK